MLFKVGIQTEGLGHYNNVAEGLTNQGKETETGKSDSMDADVQLLVPHLGTW